MTIATFKPDPIPAQANEITLFSWGNYPIKSRANHYKAFEKYAKENGIEKARYWYAPHSGEIIFCE